MKMFLDRVMGRESITDNEEERLLTFPYRDIQTFPIGGWFIVLVVEDQNQRLKVNTFRRSVGENAVKHPLFINQPYFYMPTNHNVFKNIDFNKELFEGKKVANDTYYIKFNVLLSAFEKKRLRIEHLKLFDEDAGEYFTVQNDHL